jgi:glycosyltransferase involved in cell wall biosynthesis
MPTAVDARRYEIARHVRVGNQAQLVWVGSRGTLESLYCAQAGLGKAAELLNGVTLKVICDVFPKLPGVRVLETTWSEASESREIAAADIGIAWLPEHPWSLGKCGLKVLQYMAAGLPVIANPAGVHRELVVHGETGFLVATPEQWSLAVTTLAHAPELRRRMGQAGRERLIAHYSVERLGPRFAEIIDQLAAAKHSRQSVGALAS